MVFLLLQQFKMILHYIDLKYFVDFSGLLHLLQYPVVICCLLSTIINTNKPGLYGKQSFGYWLLYSQIHADIATNLQSYCYAIHLIWD